MLSRYYRLLTWKESQWMDQWNLWDLASSFQYNSSIRHAFCWLNSILYSNKLHHNIIFKIRWTVVVIQRWNMPSILTPCTGIGHTCILTPIVQCDFCTIMWLCRHSSCDSLQQPTLGVNRYKCTYKVGFLISTYISSKRDWYNF